MKDRKINWKKCQNLKDLKEVCIELYYNIETLSIGMRLIIQNYLIYDKLISKQNICIDEKKIVSLISNIPTLSFLKLILKGLDYIYIKKLLSLCVFLDNVHLGSKSISGNVQIRFKIQDWEKVIDYGVFDFNFK
jgi:hypothetical protein